MTTKAAVPPEATPAEADSNTPADPGPAPASNIRASRQAIAASQVTLSAENNAVADTATASDAPPAANTKRSRKTKVAPRAKAASKPRGVVKARAEPKAKAASKRKAKAVAEAMATEAAVPAQASEGDGPKGEIKSILKTGSKTVRKTVRLDLPGSSPSPSPEPQGKGKAPKRTAKSIDDSTIDTDQPRRKRQRASKGVSTSDPAEESVTAPRGSPKTAGEEKGRETPRRVFISPVLPRALLNPLVFEESALRETAGRVKQVVKRPVWQRAQQAAQQVVCGRCLLKGDVPRGRSLLWGRLGLRRLLSTPVQMAMSTRLMTPPLAYGTP